MSADETQTPTAPFEERDGEETLFTFDDGGVPWYVLLVWLTMLGSLLAYLLIFLFPDLSKWGMP